MKNAIEMKDLTTKFIGNIQCFINNKTKELWIRQKDICANSAYFPGEYNHTPRIIPAVGMGANFTPKHSKLSVKGYCYIHAEDVRDYIIERQGSVENRLIRKVRGRVGGWDAATAKVIKEIFGISVRVDGGHYRGTIVPDEVADKFRQNIGLRVLNRNFQLQKKAPKAFIKHAGSWKEFAKAMKKIEKANEKVSK